MPEPGTIPLDVPGGGQLEIQAVASVASCGDEAYPIDQAEIGEDEKGSRDGERYRGRGSR